MLIFLLPEEERARELRRVARLAEALAADYEHLAAIAESAARQPADIPYLTLTLGTSLALSRAALELVDHLAGDPPPFDDELDPT